MELLVLLTFLVTLCAGVLSGMGGGGGGFVVMPYFLLIGLPPANALATAKLGDLGAACGALAAFRGKGLVQRKLIIPFMAIALVCSLFAVWLIPHINSHVFENMIGIVLLALIPSLFIKKASLQPGERKKSWIAGGFALYIVFSFLQALLGAGLGMVLVLILMFMFGQSALEASATKRIAQIVQATIVFGLLAIQGLMVWPHGIAALAGSVIGCHLGSHIAIKKGDTFVKVMFAVVMSISGVVLIVT